VPLLDRPVLSVPDARSLLAETQADPLLYAATSLMLMAGARPMEATSVTVADYQPGAEASILLGRRRIRIAPTAARAVDAYLVTQDADPAEPLLLGLQDVGVLPRLMRAAAERAGVPAGVHSLRRAAIAAALEDGAPPAHIEAYFGIEKALDRKALVPLSAGFDAGMAATLEAAFGA
jgi:integrase